MIYPRLMICLLVLVGMSPTHWFDAISFVPMLGKIAVFYFLIQLPAVVPLWFLVIIGLLEDAILGSPLGISSLAYLMWAILNEQYRDKVLGKPFVTVWSFFAFNLILFTLFQWFALSLYYDLWLPLTIIVVKILFTVAVYPLFHAAFDIICERYLTRFAHD